MVTETKTYTTSDGRLFESLTEATEWERRLDWCLGYLAEHGQYKTDARLHAAARRYAVMTEQWDREMHGLVVLEDSDPAADFIAGADPDVESLPDDPGGDADDDLDKAA